MIWDKLLNTQRLSENLKLTESSEKQRSPFHKDQDKILFSNAFRRLDKKTQAQPFPINDHAHSRLTHSLEVSCVGRSLGTRVGYVIKEDLPECFSEHDIGAIVQAACLAHDIGNPPFGHTGEDAIREWFSHPKNHNYLSSLPQDQQNDLKTFEGNAQGLRVLTQLEYFRGCGGMQLTLASLGAFLKYPWTVAHQQQGKFGCFQSELQQLKIITENLGLVSKKESSEAWYRHPLAYLMEAADDICYALLDLEDGVELNLISFEEVIALLEQILPHHCFPTDVNPNEYSNQLILLRGILIDHLVEEITETFINNLSLLMAGKFNDDLISQSSNTISTGIKAIKQVAHDKVFQNSQKMTVEIGVYSTISTLLELFIDAVHEFINHKKLTYKQDRALKILGNYVPKSEDDLYSAYMKVIDYVSGMTDQFAINLAQHLRGLRY